MIPPDRIADDGSLIPFVGGTTPYGFSLKSRGVRDGSGGRRSLKMNSSTRVLPLLYENLNGSSSTFWAAMCYLLGASVLKTDASLSRLMPWTHPEEIRVGVTEVGAKGLAFVEDDGSDVPVPTFNALDLDCTLETMPFELVPDGDGVEYDRYVETLADQPAPQYLNMPGAMQGLRLKKTDNTGPDGNPLGWPVPYNVGFAFIKNRISRKWYRVPRQALEPDSPLFNRLNGTSSSRPYQGSCNKTDFLGYPAGTLILVSYSAERVFDPVATDWCFNVTYTWDFLPNGANRLYFFDPPTDPPHATRSGWYLATRGAYAAVASLGDDDVIAYPREHRNLFKTQAV